MNKKDRFVIGNALKAIIRLLYLIFTAIASSKSPVDYFDEAKVIDDWMVDD